MLYMKIYPLRKEYLVSYDIEDNKIRTNVFKQLEQYGLRPVQKSVFWGYLTLAELNGVKRHLKDALDETDKAFITHTSFNNLRGSYFVGHTEKDFTDWEEAEVI